MSQHLDVARSHLETMIERVTGSEKAVHDHDGNYHLDTPAGRFFTRVVGSGPPILQVWAVISDGVECSEALLTELNAINCRLSFTRIIWIDGQILMETNALAFDTTTTEFDMMCDEVASTSAAFGPDLVATFGGRPVFVVEESARQEPPSQSQRPGYL